MSFPSRKAAIVGVYNSKQARNLPMSSWSLDLECMKGALDDAGLTHRDVDGLIPMAFETPLSLHMQWAEQLGGRPLSYVDVGIGAGAVSKAALAVSAGMANVVVIFFSNAGTRLGPAGDWPRPGRAPGGRHELHDPRCLYVALVCAVDPALYAPVQCAG